MQTHSNFGAVLKMITVRDQGDVFSFYRLFLVHSIVCWQHQSSHIIKHCPGLLKMQLGTEDANDPPSVFVIVK